MTAPRQILPGTTYLVTRRCAHRQFLLRPSAITTAIFSFVLAVAARRFHIRLHAFCVLSNHFHLLLTDPEAQLPAFEQYLDALVARAVNATLGRWESFWAPNSYSAVALASSDDIIDKAAYVLANPVAAGLVERGRDWPGLWSAPEAIGGEATQVSRPSRFFSSRGSMPAAAQLHLTRPPGFRSDADFRERLLQALARLEHQARQRLAKAGRRFLGVVRVMRQSPQARPHSSEPRRGLNPRFAARDRWKRAEVLARLRAFHARYREAWLAFRSGRRDALFPCGTYGLRVLFSVACATG